MRTFLRFAAVAAVATLLGVATMSTQAQAFTINQNFDTATPGTTAQQYFDPNLVTVAFAGYNGITNQWEPDLSNPQLTVQSNAGNTVLGLGDGGFNDGPIIFQLGESTYFTAFTIGIVPGTSPFATAAALGYFQTLAGAFDMFPITVNQTTASSLTLTALLPANTTAIILPGDVQYDTISLTAATVPETETAMLAVIGLATGAVGIVTRRRQKGGESLNSALSI